MGYEGYERIILIGGGIGITPCHSIFRTMLSQSIANDDDGLLPSVDLIWVAKDHQMFSLFTSTWQLFEEYNSDKHSFSLRLFATRKRGNVTVDNEKDKDENENEQKKDDSEFNNVVPDTQALMYTYGRPDWYNVLGTIK